MRQSRKFDELLTHMHHSERVKVAAFEQGLARAKVDSRESPLKNIPDNNSAIKRLCMPSFLAFAIISKIFFLPK
jgi:hypothetical protein